MYLSFCNGICYELIKIALISETTKNWCFLMRRSWYLSVRQESKKF